jgi:hypothetical protein
MLETSPGSYIKIEKSAISMEWSAALNKLQQKKKNKPGTQNIKNPD